MRKAVQMVLREATIYYMAQTATVTVIAMQTQKCDVTKLGEYRNGKGLHRR